MKELYIRYQIELIINQRLYHQEIITKEMFEGIQTKIMKILAKMPVAEGRNL